MKIKKKNLFILIFILLLLISINFYIRLLPILETKSKAYFHQLMITEIMESTKLIEVPNHFIITDNKQTSVNTTLLNYWIVDINKYLLEIIKNEYKVQLPIGYFTGILFFQNSGPNLSFEYLIENQIICSYDVKTTSLGINNAFIELILNIECKGDIFIGFEKFPFVIQENIPLAIEYIQGDVPHIYPY